MVAISAEEYCRRVEDKFHGKIVVLSKYKSARDKIKVRFECCGTVQAMLPGSVLAKERSLCKRCFDKSREKTDNQFKREVRDLVGDEYIFLDPYQGALKKIRCRHNKCGNIWETKPNRFLSGGGRCPSQGCIPKKAFKTEEEFLHDLHERVGSDFLPVEAYQGNMVKIEFKHLKCGYSWKVRPNDLMNGHGCPLCAKQVLWTTKRLQEYFDTEQEGKYSVVGEVTRAVDKVEVRHEPCGTVWKAKPSDLSNGHGCPVCNESHGEKSIRRWLDRLDIRYMAQKKFDGCRDVRPLPFDFFLVNHRMVIEYDGRQHFEPFEFFGGSIQYEKTTSHDNIKNQYCIDHGIHILRIPYTITGESIGKTIQRTLDRLDELPLLIRIPVEQT